MMHDLWSPAIPIAANIASTAEVSDSVNRWLRRSSSINESGIWIFIAMAIAAFWFGLFFWGRLRKPWKQGMDREGLFAQLCDLHQLSKSDRQLLRNVAKTQRIDQPALAFVNPNLLLKFAKSTPGAHSEVHQLANRLFGSTLVEEIVNQSPGDAPAAQ